MQEVDVVIVGAGAAGIGMALALTKIDGLNAPERMMMNRKL